MTSDDVNREELARFLRSRRQRISPAEVGLPTGPRRRVGGLLREEVAVLAGLSPTWYTYLEQGRKIRPSPEVLDSLARVLRLTEDERRYIHLLAHGQVTRPAPLNADRIAEDLVGDLVRMTDDSPYPVYAVDRYCDLMAWNRAAIEWYDDWRTYAKQPNILHWMLTSPRAKISMVDWADDARDVVARWRTDTATVATDHRVRELVAELTRVSPEFTMWWDDYYVQAHRSRVRRLRHPVHGVKPMRVLPTTSPEYPAANVVFHIPVADDTDESA